MIEAIRRRVIRVIAETLEIPVQTLSPETRIKADLGADSMQIVTIMIGLDEEFDVEFKVDQLPTGEVTIDGIVNFVTVTVEAARVTH